MTAASPTAVAGTADDRDIAVPSARSWSLDLARGSIVILMALDHVRIYFAAAQFDPVDLEATTPGYFFTRVITHVCAPGFFFIAGLSAALYEAKASGAAAARFLLSRGAWLIALELIVFGFAWSFSPGWFWFGVIWGLGAAMILLGLALPLGKPVLLAAGLAVTLLHNALLPASGGDLWALLYSGGAMEAPIIGDRLVIYPLMPWLALMLIGYGAAPWLAPRGRLDWDRALKVGAASIALFVAARIAGFGSPPADPFTAGGDLSQRIMGFLNVEKYPPSLQFSAITIGLLLVVASIAERWRGAFERIARPMVLIGRVPFFFYLLHLFVIHLAALLTATALGWPTDYLFWSGIGPNLIPPDGYGLPLGGVYVAWAVIVGLLYPACRWFARLKSARGDWWLKYL